MTYKEKFEEYKRTLLNEASAPEEDAKLLESILQDARILNDPTDGGDKKLKAIRTKLHHAIKQHFDDREDCVRVVNDFFAEINGDAGAERFLRTQDIYDPDELKFKLLQYLQDGGENKRSHSRAEIGEKFALSANPVDNYLKELTGPDASLFGTSVKIEELGYGTNVYDSTIHPAFFALNLSEVYFLTTVVRTQYKGTQYETVANHISDCLVGQLSDYAKEKLKSHFEACGISMEERPSRGYKRENQDDFLMLEKSGSRYEVTFVGRADTVIGRSKHTLNGPVFETDDGEEIPYQQKDILSFRKIEKD